MLTRALVNLDADVANVGRKRFTNEFFDLGEADVDVVLTGFGLGCWREQRFGERRCLLETGLEFDAANRAARLVVTPARADQLAADDRLDGQRLEALHDE